MNTDYRKRIKCISFNVKNITYNVFRNKKGWSVT